MSQSLGSCVIVFDSSTNAVLLGKRKNSYKAGMYGLPGGTTEIGEKVEATARRELTEETGLFAKEIQLIGLVKERQDQYDFLHFVFVCESWDGELTCVEPEKCEGWEWFSLDNLSENLLEGHKHAIQMWQEKNGWLIEV